MTVDYGTAIVLPIPTNAHASYFAGWFTGTTVNDGQFFNYTPICSDLTLTAKWVYTREFLENGAVNISPVKDLYYYGDKITVTPKDVTNKTFSLHNFDVIYGTSVTQSYSNKKEITATVGKYTNFTVSYIDTPASISPFQGTYTGEYIDYDNEVQTVSIDFDGYGLYSIDGVEYAMQRYELGQHLPYDPTVTSGYLIENEHLTFENCTFVSETKPDGKEYTFITTTYDSYSGYEEATFWLNGNAYVEPVATACPAAGTFTATFYDSESEADVTRVATIDEEGNGETNEDGYVQTFTVTDTSDFPNSFEIETSEGDISTITLQADGTYKGRFGEGKSKSYTFEKYVFPFAGTFSGTDGEDCACTIIINEDKTGEYQEGGIKLYDLTVTEFDYPNSLTVTFDDYGEEVTKTITLNTDGVTYKGRIGEYTVSNYTFTKKTACIYAGVFEGVDSDDTACRMEIDASGHGVYYEGGSEYCTFDIIEYITDPSEKFVILTSDGDEITISKQANGTFKGRVGSSSVIYTFTPAA